MIIHLIVTDKDDKKFKIIGSKDGRAFYEKIKWTSKDPEKQGKLGTYILTKIIAAGEALHEDRFSAKKVIAEAKKLLKGAVEAPSEKSK